MVRGASPGLRLADCGPCPFCQARRDHGLERLSDWCGWRNHSGKRRVGTGRPGHVPRSRGGLAATGPARGRKPQRRLKYLLDYRAPRSTYSSTCLTVAVIAREGGGSGAVKAGGRAGSDPGHADLRGPAPRCPPGPDPRPRAPAGRAGRAQDAPPRGGRTAAAGQDRRPRKRPLAGRRARRALAHGRLARALRRLPGAGPATRRGGQGECNLCRFLRRFGDAGLVQFHRKGLTGRATSE
jgi:hypothetical protein